MVALSQPMNVNSIDTSVADFSPIPAADYNVQLTGEKPNAHFGCVDFEFVIMDGEFAGRKIWQSVDVEALEDWKGRKLAAQLAKTVGINDLMNTDELMGRNYRVTINRKVNKNDPTKIYNNVVDAIMPAASGYAPSAPPAAVAPIPTAPPAAVAPIPAAPIPATPVPGPAPWGVQ